MGEKLPYDYEVEWIGANGTQWADTEMIWDSSFAIDLYIVDFLLGGTGICGARANWLDRMIHVASNQDGLAFCFRNKYQTNIKIQNHADHHIRIANGKLYVDGELKSSFNYTSFNCGKSAYIFAVHDNDRTIFLKEVPTKIKKMVVSDKNNLAISELIGVVKNNVPCLYDTIRKKFLFNQGTDNFIIGPKI